MIGFRKKNLIGLDIDTTAVRMVQLRRENGAYSVTAAYSAEIAPWGDDPELRRIHTVRAIQQGLSKRTIDGKLAVCGLRGPEVVVRSFEFPFLLPEEVGSAVGLEASQICPFSPDESAFDYQVTSMDDGKTRGFWVAANNGLIRATRQIVHEAGLHCALLDIAGLALLNCLRYSARQATDAPADPDVLGGQAVVDIGGVCTTIAIRDHAGRPFVRDINSGSDHILSRMAEAARVPFEIARTALLQYGAPQDRADHTDGQTADLHRVEPALFWNHLEGACDSLVEDIATTLRYYAVQQGSGLATQRASSGGSSPRIERLLICGALAQVGEFIELLRAKLHIDVAAWTPVDTMRGDGAKAGQSASAVQTAGSSMSLAAGLAMRNL